MLQRVNVGVDDSARASDWLKPAYYWRFISRRWLYILGPFLLISIAGAVVARLLPPIFFAEGKVLIQPPQIASDLVRTTITTTTQDRIQVLNQRAMTRDNLLAIIEKFDLFPRQRQTYTVLELVDQMRNSIRVNPLEPPLGFGQRKTENSPIVVAIGFEYPDAAIAKLVVDELIHRIVSEDVRDRTSRAEDTAMFLKNELEKLQKENDELSASIAKARVASGRSATTGSDPSEALLAQLKEEYTRRSPTYSDSHPIQRALKLRIATLESSLLRPRTTAESKSAGAEESLEALLSRQLVARKNMELASAKLSAAQAGEHLEKNQQAEKLEVIEAPTVPQKPLRPNRLKIIVTSLQLGLAAGVVLAFFVETIDGRIRSSTDLSRLTDQQLVVSIPYIFTAAEPKGTGRRALVALILFLIVAVCIVALGAATSTSWQTPISELWKRVYIAELWKGASQ
jgi:uncharacterized protein involved in exopolysaccharide biosynthesis